MRATMETDDGKHGAAADAAVRRAAFAVAYRMLGSAEEAEDVVQEALLRLHEPETPGEAIAAPRAYIATVATRLAIDQLRSARVKRTAYPGEWLPEPLLTRPADPADDPAAQAELADSLSIAFLALLERLSPEQRAALLLHDVFGYGYDEVARIVGTTEGNARQLTTRARRSRSGSSPPRAAATSVRSRRCWPRTSRSTATAAARCRRSRARSTAGRGWRGRSPRGPGRRTSRAARSCAPRRSTAGRAR
jgi:RNA polymerase sigma factor (sigma-70 family)